VIQRALSLMQEQMRLRQINVRISLCESRPMVIGNAIQLEQVFINLLTNARDAVGASPRRSISIECAINGGAVELAFSDTGPGIPNGLEQRIFDPFFTTKDVGKGTGLGLSITYGILKEHYGTITVAKKPPGEGATFVIQLPLADGAPRES
jgi:C4-dicarboxylate-specific signal transduction histidine kinase